MALGATQCDFVGAATSGALAVAVGRALRSARARGRRASASAQLELPDAEVWLIAVPLRAYPQARVEGTTGYFGRGEVAAGATLVAVPQHIKPGFGSTVCAGAGHGAAHLACFGAGRAANDTRFNADPYFVRNGVKYHDGWASALATAMGHATPYIYSICLSVGRALPAAAAARWIPAIARVTVRASGSARWQMVVPAAAEPAVLRSEAKGAAAARLAAKGRGQVLAASLASAPGRARRSARGVARGTAKAQSGAAIFLIRGLLRAVASLVGRGGRVLLAGGNAQAAAAVSGFNQVNDLMRAPRERTVTVGTSDRTAAIAGQPRTVVVAAQSRQLAA